VRDFPKQAGDLPREPQDDEREIYLLRSDETGVKLIGATDLAVEHAVWDFLWTLYFYVPRGTTVISGFADGAGELQNPDGTTAHTFGDAPRAFSVPVPAGSDGTLWKFYHGNGRRLLMTVPPYMARTSQELLLPREVVELR
jgi:hypothetical protein